MQIFLASVLVCVALVVFLRGLFFKAGLVDRPGGRKLHAQATPVVGGLAMFVAVVCILYFKDLLVGNTALLMSAGGCLILLGILDDKHGLPISLRILAQALVSLAVILNAGGTIWHLGNFVGKEILLGTLAIPLSMVAFVGGINAINMIDGADGMAGKIASITLLGIAVIMERTGDVAELPLVWAMLGALAGFLLFNSRLFIKRAWIFMGDSGSMWLGLVLGWFMVQVTRGVVSAEPPIVMWLFGLPLIDTLAVMLRRLSHKNSPFMADRTHIHHVLEDAGLSVKVTVLLLSAVQLLLVGTGVVFYFQHVSAAVMFWSFVLLFTAYYYVLRHGRINIWYFKRLQMRYELEHVEK